jgi:phospholipid-binding lipoprotein MlaA
LAQILLLKSELLVGDWYHKSKILFMNMDPMRMLGKVGACLAVAVLAGGCATPPPGANAYGQEPHDPLEAYNRSMFAFNDALDGALLKPVAQAYKQALPSMVRTGVGNFFNNLWEPWTAFNALLQGKPVAVAETALRFGFNSTFGLGGLIDMAGGIGIERHNEDFGQTLGAWGFGAGPYVVLPLMGPSSLRDTIGLATDYRGDLPQRLPNLDAVSALSVVRLVNFRASLLGAERVVEEAALDKYSFVRDSYLQRRQNQVYDGDEPPEPSEPQAKTPESRR